MKKSILFFTCSFLILLIACGDKKEVSGEKKDEQKKNESVQEKSDSKSEEKTNKEDESDGQSKEEVNKSNELGMTPGFPSNYPNDIPKPMNAKTLGSINTSEGTVVTFESTDKVLDVVNYYKDGMKKNGFTITEGGENLVSDKGGLINWTKDKRQVGLMLGFDKDKNITSLVITYTQ